MPGPTVLLTAAQWVVVWLDVNGSPHWDGQYYTSQANADATATAIANSNPSLQVVVAKTVDWWKSTPPAAVSTATL